MPWLISNATGKKLPTRLLFQEIVVGLDAAEVVLPHRGAAFLEASRARAEGDAVVPNFSLGLHVLKGLPHGGIPDGRGIRVVELQDVHIGRGESIERLVERGLDRARREVRPALRAAHLARNDDEFASLLERLPEDALPSAVS